MENWTIAGAYSILYAIPLICIFENLTIFSAVPVDLIKGTTSYKPFPAVENMVMSCLLSRFWP